MPFQEDLKKEINNYIYGHLPDEEWYDQHFYPFIKDNELRDRLIVEYKNCRIIYKIFEGLQVHDDLLLAQVKTQVIMYVSIQEAVINYVLFNLFQDNEAVQNLLHQERLVSICIPKAKKKKLDKELSHSGKEILTYYKEKRAIDKTKIRYDQKVNVIYALKLISESLKEDLIKLYEYRNTVHIEAEIRKNLKYDLEMGELAYRRVEGLSIELVDSLHFCDV